MQRLALLNEQFHIKRLKIFTPVHTLLKKQEVQTQFAAQPQIITHLQTSTSSYKKASTLYQEQIQINRLGSSQTLLTSQNIMQQQADLLLMQQGSQINMVASNQFIKGSTLLNNQYNEQATVYLKEIEQKNQNKFISQKEDIDIFKYLSLTYNVNSIVNPSFNSSLKHTSISREVMKVCVDSIKINNRTLVARQTLNNMLMPQQTRPNGRISFNVYKNILTFLQFENKQEMQLIVVDIANLGGPLPQSPNQNQILSSSFRLLENNCLQQYRATPVSYHLNCDSSREPSPFIAFDKISGRHFIYNNDDKILVFSHKPISNSLIDKSKPLVIMSLDDRFDGISKSDMQKSTGFLQGMDNSTIDQSKSIFESKARINPTLQIISDHKGNQVLLVIGGYIEGSSGTIIPKRNIKVFQIGKRDIDVKPAFQISLKHPRVNPIVIRVKQSDCKDAKASVGIENKYLILLGGATTQTVEDKTMFTNTNTQCSVIEYESIFNQIMRKDVTELTESKTLKVLYNDKDKGKNHEKFAEKLSKGAFLHQRDKSNTEIHNKMFIVCDKRRHIFHINAISLSENFISIFDTDTEIRAESSWNHTNICNIDNCIVYIGPQQFIPFVVETNGKNQKSMQSEELVEFNKKNGRKENIFEIKPNKNVKSCQCSIY